MLKTTAQVLALLCVSLTTPIQTDAAPPARAYRDKVQPHWFADNTRFWYRIDVAPDAYQFVLVDATKAARQPAFDHARLAAALAAAGVEDCPARRLPLLNLEFEPAGGAIRFRAADKGWRCDLNSYVLKQDASAASAPSSSNALEDGPRASRRTGEETSLRFVNRTGGEVKLFWLDSEGQRQGYGSLGPGETREQPTFAGHVWLVTDA